ncbi:cytochrome P450 [Lophiotrema nucula]|uniref:Cytochrome P450 n=1 Tax=Lophiotrema nucula TaxID=690887 RepID=A0A6A5YNR4_9PLEO|nr:cytochrome P450 [Lophiotrema nucula]
MKDVKSDPDHNFLSSLARYGEMAAVHLWSKTWIMLNTEHNEILSRNQRSLLLPHGPWTERRRVMHPLLSGTVLMTYGDWQELESDVMSANYIEDAGLCKGLEDLQEVQTTFTNTICTSVIDWFPELDRILRFLQPWRPYWNKMDQRNHDVFNTWWKPVKEKFGSGTAPPSFVRDTLLHENTKFKSDELDAMYLTMQLIEAGSGTTRETLNIMVMAYVFYPDVFKRARDEVDKICGSHVERLPIMDDMENLGYICALAKELLRVGFVLNGICLSNECESSDEFRPERWMNGHVQDPLHGMWQFGGGRRVCVGYRLAFRSVFVNIARLVYCFDYAAWTQILKFCGPTDEPFPIKIRNMPIFR